MVITHLDLARAMEELEALPAHMQAAQQAKEIALDQLAQCRARLAAGSTPSDLESYQTALLSLAEAEATILAITNREEAVRTQIHVINQALDQRRRRP